MNKYLSKFPKEYLNRVMIHTHHRLALKYNLMGIHLTEKQKKKRFLTWSKLKVLKMFKPGLSISTSFHSISDLLKEDKQYVYVFLSPVFNSVSKKNYNSAFNEEVMQKALTQAHHQVIALGGVKSDNITRARDLGFKGVAVLGSIWSENIQDPVQAFKEIYQSASDTSGLRIQKITLEI